MKDYHDLFDEHDARTAAKEAEYERQAPKCCCCQEPILTNDAIYVDGEWFCKSEECMKEFYSDMRSKYRRNIA